MRIKEAVQRIPGGMMIVPLMLGALVNTIDQAHIPFIESILQGLGAPETADGHYEFFQIPGFSRELFKTGALALIGLFLFCAGSQMNLRIGGKALKKGLLLTASKYLTGLTIGYFFAVFWDRMGGPLGLSTMAIIAAMTNSNGGMYAALTGQYGNRSDVGAVAILSLNDGPFFTMLGLGMMGEKLPLAAFLAVLLPIGLGMLLGNLDHKLRKFLKPGERLTIPFFAFALGMGMNFGVFLNTAVLAAGAALGLMTALLTGGAGILALKLFGERSRIAGLAEASTAGNAVATPAAIAAAAAAAVGAGLMSPEVAQRYQDIVPLATAQISISTLLTALICPALVIAFSQWQKKKGIDATVEDGEVNEATNGDRGKVKDETKN